MGDRKRSYGEACRLAHALDVVGERWALLVIRELLLGPKRFTDLRTGLPHASSNILAERLRELEGQGVIRWRKLPPPSGAAVYELTDWGRELEPVVTRLGAWGARSPFPPSSREIGVDSIVLALRSLFDIEAAGDTRGALQLRLGEQSFLIEVGDGELTLSRGSGEADVTISTDPPTLAGVLTGQLSLEQAEAGGALTLEGSRRTARRLLRLFPMPEAHTAPEVAEAA